MIQNEQPTPPQISGLNVKNEDLKFFIKEHTDFINGCLDIIARGKLPKYSHKTVIENLCKAHGFIEFHFPNSTEPFFIRQSNLLKFKGLVEKAVENTNNPAKDDSSKGDNT